MIKTLPTTSVAVAQLSKDGDNSSLSHPKPKDKKSEQIRFYMSFFPFGEKITKRSP